MTDPLFALNDAYEQLNQAGDAWQPLAKVVDFEQFRDLLEAC